LTWLGVPVPALRRVVSQLSATLAAAPPAAVIDLALALVAGGVIEERQVGYELIGRRPDALALIDRDLARRLGAGNDNWAAVDAFATSVTGPAWRTGALTDRDLLVWAHDRDDWWRRVALVSTVALNTPSRGGRGDRRRTLRICRVVVGHLTPMMARALSWALRSLAPHDPAGVRAFVDRHQDRLPPFVVREVTTKVSTGRKRLPTATA
jgi:3-methyladenine DNA glycosylase AlkD